MPIPAIRIIRRPTYAAQYADRPVIRYDVTVNDSAVVSFDADDKDSMRQFANDSTRCGDDVYVLTIQ